MFVCVYNRCLCVFCYQTHWEVVSYLAFVCDYDLSDYMPSYYIYEIPEKIQDPIQKSRPLHLDGCINKFVCAVSRIPVREICSLQIPSESMSLLLETMYNAYYGRFLSEKLI